jgi:hypothetical protein
MLVTLSSTCLACLFDKHGDCGTLCSQLARDKVRVYRSLGSKGGVESCLLMLSHVALICIGF